MSPQEIQGKTVPIKLWAPVTEVESQALDQLKNVAALPWVFHHVAAMADCHFGKGCTVGSVIAMKGALAPAAVGVDIGCGMTAVETDLRVDVVRDQLKELRDAIEATIPVGMNANAALVVDRSYGHTFSRTRELLAEFGTLDSRVQKLESRATCQIGSLGGGNHFIEVCVDTSDKVWLMLHSGSRNIGKELAEIHIEIAQKLAHNQDLPDRDLAVFLAKTPEMAAYRRDLFWAQRYAALNREVMLYRFMEVLRRFWPMVTCGKPVMCHHNYVAEETHFGEDVFVTRKGAIRAGVGEYGIIPGSMGTKSYIVQGRGNPESFESASHGAGRRMSRGKAKKVFTQEDLIEQTRGVECRKDTGVLDEIPGAYKDIEAVMANQADLVTIVAELKQIVCIKG